MLPPGVRRGFSGSSLTASAVLTLSVDITSATVGEWVYCFLVLRFSEASTAMTGWTNVFQSTNATDNLTHTCYRRRKVAGDTTFSITWSATTTQGVALIQEWIGLDSVTPDTGNNTTVYTAAGGSFPTPSATSISASEWGVGFYSVISAQSTQKTATWTFSGDMTNSDQTGSNVNGTVLWANAAIADSNVALSQASHSGTASTTNFAYNGGAATILFLNPQPIPLSGVLVSQAVNRAGVF